MRDLVLGSRYQRPAPTYQARLLRSTPPPGAHYLPYFAMISSASASEISSSM